MKRTLCQSLLCVALLAAPLLPARADGLPQARANQADATFTDDSLCALLGKLGYQPAAYRYSDGIKYYLIKVQRYNRNWTLTVEIAPNKRVVGFGMRLHAGAATMDRNRLFRLLQENDRIKARFLIGDKGKSLYLTGYFDNRSVSADLFQTELALFLADVVKTEALWKNP
jgi:hypothetical protein